MKKKLVYLGGILIIIALIILVALIFQLNSLSSSFSSIDITNFTVPTSGFYGYAFNSSGKAHDIISVVNDKLDVILFSAKGYDNWSRSNETLSSAFKLNKTDLILVAYNTTNFTIPTSPSNLVYESNIINTSDLEEGILPKGNYTLVFYNGNGSFSKNSSVKGVISYLSASKVKEYSSKMYHMAIYGVTMTILIIIGVILILYGVFKKDKKAPEVKSSESEYIDKLYSYGEKPGKNKAEISSKPKVKTSGKKPKYKKGSKKKGNQGNKINKED